MLSWSFRLPVRTGACLVLALLMAGCAAPPRGGDEEAETRFPVWPSPPDRPRFAFEVMLRAPADLIEAGSQAALRRQLTGDTSAEKPAFEKIGAVVARYGRVYVADTFQKRIVVFDVPRRKLFHFGLRSPGELQKPVAMAVDEAQNVYVADAGRRRVLVYDGLGLHQRTLGEGEDLVRPAGVAVSPDGERVYVVDRSSNEDDRHRIVVFDKEGHKVREFGRRGIEPGEFNIPVQAAVGPDGLLYVLDAGNFRVQAFDSEGNFLRAFGSSGTSLGTFGRPRGLAVDGAGRIYVTDGFFGNLQVFDGAGELLLPIGRHGTRDLPGRYGLIASVAVDETGRIYIADQLFNKIEVIRPVASTDGAKPEGGGT